ncbi:MAG: hypothetical protein JSV79_11580, partial [Armatimonadota bacterium]
ICRQVTFIRPRPAQITVACLAIVFLVPLLILEILLLGRASAVFWLGAMCIGALLFIICWFAAKARGANLRQVFASLPTTAEDVEFASGPVIKD